MAKGTGYTSIAKGMPKGTTKAGVDNYKVLGGQPGGGSTPKGTTTNKGKMKGSY
jgi:hypothetical protein